MTFAAAVLALTVVFPKPGARLPAVDRTYLIGATEPGVSGLSINGTNVAVHAKGGFVTMLDTVAGTNRVTVKGTDGSVLTNYDFFVTARPPAAPTARSANPPAPPKPYARLPYSVDEPRTNRAGVVYLDAGHGGKDTGTLSPHGLPEKDANLLMVKAVAAELAKLGVETVLTREEDVALEIYDRPRAVHADKTAAAFVSIHHNAPPIDRDPRLCRYHAVYAWNPLGEALAKPINAAMAETLGTSLANNGVLKANYAVTRSNEVPSCLVEVDFMTTPEGELDCWDRERRQRIAAAIAKGIKAWKDELH